MKNKDNYKVEKSLSAGKNSTYTIKGNDGKESGLGFGSKSEAQSHIDSRIALGQDPLSWSTDYDAMADALLNS